MLWRSTGRRRAHVSFCRVSTKRGRLLSRNRSDASYKAAIACSRRGPSIVERHRDNEHARLNERWRPALMAFFLRRVRDHPEAEDLTQEVFVRMLRSDAVDGAPDHYIFQIAQNLLVDRARRAGVRRRYQDAMGPGEDYDVDPLDPQRVALGRAELARFAAALEALPERTRVMFTLYRIEQMSQDVIGEAFGISKSAVKKQIAAAMALIMVAMRAET